MIRTVRLLGCMAELGKQNGRALWNAQRYRRQRGKQRDAKERLRKKEKQ